MKKVLLALGLFISIVFAVPSVHGLVFKCEDQYGVIYHVLRDSDMNIVFEILDEEEACKIALDNKHSPIIIDVKEYVKYRETIGKKWGGKGNLRSADLLVAEFEEKTGSKFKNLSSERKEFFVWLNELDKITFVRR